MRDEFRKLRSDLFKKLQDKNALDLYPIIENEFADVFFGKPIYCGYDPKKITLTKALNTKGYKVDKTSIYDLMDDKLLHVLCTYYKRIIEKVNFSYSLEGRARSQAKYNYKCIARDQGSFAKEIFTEDKEISKTPYQYLLGTLKHKQEKVSNIEIFPVIVRSPKSKSYSLVAKNKINSYLCKEKLFTLEEIDKYTGTFKNKEELYNYLASTFDIRSANDIVKVAYNFSKKNESDYEIIYKDDLERLTNINETILSHMEEPKFLKKFSDYFYHCFKRTDDENQIYGNVNSRRLAFLAGELSLLQERGANTNETMGKIAKQINTLTAEHMHTYKDKRDLYFMIKKYEDKQKAKEEKRNIQVCDDNTQMSLFKNIDR